MKNILYIFILFAIFGCNNNESKSVTLEVAEDETLFDIKEDIVIIPETNKSPVYIEHSLSPLEIKGLTAQKLQELYDLLALQNQHPEFQETIASQLKNYTSDTTLELAKTMTSVTLQNISLLDIENKVSDSVQNIKIAFTIISKESSFQDTIYAKIKSEKIVLDQKEIISNKIVFTKQE